MKDGKIRIFQEKFNVGGYIKDIKRDLGYKEVKANVEI